MVTRLGGGGGAGAGGAGAGGAGPPQTEGNQELLATTLPVTAIR